MSRVGCSCLGGCLTFIVISLAGMAAYMVLTGPHSNIQGPAGIQYSAPVGLVVGVIIAAILLAIHR